MSEKTIYHSPPVVKLALLFPTLALVTIGFLCGIVAAPLVSGFKLGYKLSRQYLMLADLEK